MAGPVPLLEEPAGPGPTEEEEPFGEEVGPAEELDGVSKAEIAVIEAPLQRMSST